MIDRTASGEAGVTFPATLTFDGDEMEVAETRDGIPYIVFRNVRIDTGCEIVDRTVMAFGDAMDAAAPLRIPNAPVVLEVRDAGRVIKIAGESRRIAA